MRAEFADARNVDEAISESVANGRFGAWTRVLCVCSAAVMRSPTLAWVLSHNPYNCNTISAGSHAHKALVQVSQPLLNWAQKVVFANPINHEFVRDSGLRIPEDIYVLNIPDYFAYRDPELVDAIHEHLRIANFKE